MTKKPLTTKFGSNYVIFIEIFNKKATFLITQL